MHGGNGVRRHAFEARRRIEAQRRREEKKEKRLEFIANAICFISISLFIIAILGVHTLLTTIALYFFFDKVVNRKRS